MSDGIPSFDLAELLAPIEGNDPSGADLRRSPTYDQLKELRREDDSSIDHGIWQTEPKVANWDGVINLGVEAIQGQSKDLRIAAWMTEALLAKYGPEGASRGFTLMAALVENFWDDLHPAIEDGDVESRLAPLEWINTKLSLRLKGMPLTASSIGEARVFSWADHERAALYDRSGTKKGEGGITSADVMTAALMTPYEFYKALADGLQAVMTSVVALESAVDQQTGETHSSLWQFRDTLGQIQAFVVRALKERGEESLEVEEPMDDSVIDLSVGGGEGLKAPTAVRGPIKSRAEAYQRLAEAAEYLMRIEPHSPVPHLIRRAVNWGNLTFSDLITELVNDTNNIRSIYSLLGINTPSDQ
jgi:type VI secretion system ImpA family protein